MDRKAQIAAQRRRWYLAKAIGLPVYSAVLDASERLDAANADAVLSETILKPARRLLGTELLLTMLQTGRL